MTLSEPVRRILSAAFLSIAVGISACATHSIGATLRIDGISLGALMTAEQIQRAVAGMTCQPPDAGRVETCTTTVGWEEGFLAAMLFDGRVAGIVAVFPSSGFDDFSQDLTRQLGKGERVEGVAQGQGSGSADVDQVVHSWEGPDGRFVRLVKRAPIDPSFCAFIALTKPLIDLEDAKPRSGMSARICEDFPGVCPRG